MYSFIKSVAKTIIPSRLFRRHEQSLRKIVSLPYLGSSVKCNVCSTGLRKFIQLSDADKLCPSCGSRSRSRQLLSWLESLRLADQKILHFSPPSGLRSLLKKRFGQDYLTTDYLNEFKADLKLDITQTGQPDHSFDLVICLHVLEHIENDKAAMQELQRILKPNGILVLQTPFLDRMESNENLTINTTRQENGIYENPAITSGEDRLKHFGQEDHVRWYTTAGLLQRLDKQCPGLKAEIIEFKEKPELGILPEVFIIATKSC